MIALQDAYSTLDAPLFESLLHPGFGLVSEQYGWCRDAHVCLHRRIFASAAGTPIDPPLPPDLAVAGISATFELLSPFVPIYTYYQTAAFPAGLDPDQWRLTAASCRVTALFDLRGDTDYRPTSTPLLVVAEDLAKQPGQAGKYTLFRWNEAVDFSGASTAPQSTAGLLWGRFLPIFGGGCEFCAGGPPQPPIPDVIRTPEELVQAVAASIEGLTPAIYRPLLFGDFLYYVDASVSGARSWNRDEELRIFDRMAHPQDYMNSDRPVPDNLWPTELDFVVTGTSNFTERSEYYASAGNPTGLNRSRWRVVAASFRINGNLHTTGASPLEFSSNTSAVVAEDMQAVRGAIDRFFLYRWFDSGMPAMQTGTRAVAIPTASWSTVKMQYR